MQSYQIIRKNWLLTFVIGFVSSFVAAPTIAQEKPIVIAHRGACGYLPEHTLEAASMAHAMKVDFIEQDLSLIHI